MRKQGFCFSFVSVFVSTAPLPVQGSGKPPHPSPPEGPWRKAVCWEEAARLLRLALQIVFAAPCASPISYSHTEAPGGPEGRLEAGGRVLYGALASRLGGLLPTPRENKVCSPGGILRLSDFILLGKGF